MNKKMMKYMLISFATISVPVIAAECADDSDWAALLNAKKLEIRTQVGEQIDTSVDVTDSPYLYTNSDAGCDLGFSMPGLPDIGLGLTGIDACELLQAVTGDMVSELNDSVQSSLDDALESVVGDTDLSQDIDLGDVAEDAITGD